MIAAVSCLLIALACQDVERPVGPAMGPPKASGVATPPVLLSLTCILERKSTAISCKPAIPSPAAGVSANVIYGATASYAIFFPYNLVKDTVSHTWAFTAYLQNLLKQSIGTLNSTTVTGVKVFVTDFHATAGTGTVSVANADGTGNFTAPNQPYFNYNQIVAPSGYSASKLWKFNVPNTVTAVSMSILISTDFPAEQSVTSVPPDTIAKWVQADSNTGGRAGPTAIGVAYQKRTIKIVFQPSATLADRQLAVASVNGVVVGGYRSSDGVSGWYIVQVPDDGTGKGVLTARGILRKQPQVKSATVTIYMSGLELTPRDGPGFRSWGLSPDSVSHADSAWNWNLVAVDAPYAWGCSIGNTNTKIGIVDYGFHAEDDLTNNVASASTWVFSIPNDTARDDHGTRTASVLAAVGNNAVGGPAPNITGAMWRASLIAGNVKLLDSATHHIIREVMPLRLATKLVA